MRSVLQPTSIEGASAKTSAARETALRQQLRNNIERPADLGTRRVLCARCPRCFGQCIRANHLTATASQGQRIRSAVTIDCGRNCESYWKEDGKSEAVVSGLLRWMKGKWIDGPADTKQLILPVRMFAWKEARE